MSLKLRVATSSDVARDISDIFHQYGGSWVKDVAGVQSLASADTQSKSRRCVQLHHSTEHLLGRMYTYKNSLKNWREHDNLSRVIEYLETLRAASAQAASASINVQIQEYETLVRDVINRLEERLTGG